MSELGITLPLQADQSLASFCSQVASANGASSAREFCMHMGMQFQHVVDGTAESIERLAVLSGVGVSCLSKAAVIKQGGMYLINGEKLRRPFLRRSRLRYCPACLIGDNAREDRLPQARLYGRRDWLVSFIRTCPVHQIEFATLENPAGPSLLHDFTAVMRDKSLDLDSVLAGSQGRNPSNFEQYVTGRLTNGTASVGYLDLLPLYAAGRSCEMLGAILEHGIKVASDNISESQWWSCAESGFKVMSNGEEAIRECLTAFHDRFFTTSRDIGGRSLYGRFYEWLAHENEDSAYDPIRDLIRAHAVATLPLGPGDEMFGPLTIPRRWHSVHTAAREFGVHPKRLRKLAIGAGLAKEAAIDLTDDRILLDASEVETLIRHGREALSYNDARAYVNAPRVQWEILIKLGYVKPFVETATGPALKAKFSLSELDRFLAKISRSGIGEPVVGETYTIPDASKRANCKASEVIDLLLQGELREVAIDTMTSGFLAVQVNPSEIRRKTALIAHGGVSLKQAEKNCKRRVRFCGRSWNLARSHPGLRSILPTVAPKPSSILLTSSRSKLDMFHSTTSQLNEMNISEGQKSF